MTPPPTTRARTTAVVLAGGIGSRFGAAAPKQLVTLAGRPVLVHSLEVFEQSDSVDDIVLVMPAEHVGAAEALVRDAGMRKVTAVVAGGATRSDSSRRGLEAVTGGDDGNVLLHDAARPLVTEALVSSCVDALATATAVVLAVPAPDTMLVVSDGAVAEVADRQALWRAQTPQGFRLSVIRAAYERAAADPSFTATDDGSVVRRYLPDVEVRVVPGSAGNIKLTVTEDLAVAEALLRSRE
jgi:2-C-methyl-D-erythritol 4-phosphate cytidylyltransferase